MHIRTQIRMVSPPYCSLRDLPILINAESSHHQFTQGRKPEGITDSFTTDASFSLLSLNHFPLRPFINIHLSHVLRFISRGPSWAKRFLRQKFSFNSKVVSAGRIHLGGPGFSPLVLNTLTMFMQCSTIPMETLLVHSTVKNMFPPKPRKLWTHQSHFRDVQNFGKNSQVAIA